MSHKQMVGAWLGAALALAAVPASAIDVDAFTRRVETAGVGGLTYLGRARAVGEDVVVDSVGVEFGDTTYVFEGQFTFAGIAMQPDRGYVVDSVTAPEIVLRDTSTRVVTAKLSDFSLTGFVVPGKSGPDGAPHLSTLHTGPFTWREIPLSVDAFSIEFEPTFANEAVTSVTMSAAVEGMRVSLPEVPRESDAFTKTLVALEVDELTFDISGSMVWQDDGLLTYTEHIGFGEFGASHTEVVVSGLTRDKMVELATFFAAAQEGSSDANLASINALVGVAINGASFRVEAGPLLHDVIEYLDDEQGGNHALVADFEEAVMTEVEALDIPPVAALVRPALRAFLAQPSSLEARIDPAAPVTFISLAAAAMTNKAGIAPLLGLTITANEPPRADAP